MDRVKKILELKRLLDSGILTEQEFMEAKENLLSDSSGNPEVEVVSKSDNSDDVYDKSNYVEIDGSQSMHEVNNVEYETNQAPVSIWRYVLAIAFFISGSFYIAYKLYFQEKWANEQNTESQQYIDSGQPNSQPSQEQQVSMKFIGQKLENNGLSAYQIGGSYAFGSDVEIEPVGSLKVYPISDESAYFFVSVCVGAPSYNLGDMFGLMTKSSGDGEFYSDGKDSYFNCKLKFKFVNDKVKITTEESTPCDFGGSGVSADYTYTLSDKNIPKTFTNNEDKTFRFDRTTLKSYYQ